MEQGLYFFLLLLFALVYGYLLDLKHAVETKWLKPAVNHTKYKRFSYIYNLCARKQ